VVADATVVETPKKVEQRGPLDRWIRPLFARIQYSRADNGGDSVSTTDWTLQEGAPPFRIARDVYVTRYGDIGPRHVNFFPTTGGMDRIIAPRIIPFQNRVTLPHLALDDSAWIPAVYVGNPQR
jgi:hypothetical protein